MQTERTPTTTPPVPGRNSQEPPEDKNSIAAQMKAGNRILGWSFLASILINIGFGIWLSFADLYGTQRTAAEQHRIKIQLYRPPIKHPKPKPKPKIIPPKIIPPKPIKQVVIKPQPVHRPPPPAPRAPAVGHTVKTNSPTAVAVGPISQTPVAVPQTPGTDTRPQAPPVAPPAPPPAVITPSAPPAPVVQAPPAPPPPPPAPKHPPGYVADIDSREASVDDSSIPQIDTSGMNIDPSTLTGPCIVSFKVDTNGHIASARIKKSSGNADFDDACVKAIRQAHGVPAIQDHILYEAQGEWSFNAN